MTSAGPYNQPVVDFVPLPSSYWPHKPSPAPSHPTTVLVALNPLCIHPRTCSPWRCWDPTHRKISLPAQHYAQRRPILSWVSLGSIPGWRVPAPWCITGGWWYMGSYRKPLNCLCNKAVVHLDVVIIVPWLKVELRGHMLLIWYNLIYRTII